MKAPLAAEKTYLTILFRTAAALALCVALINFCVDPLGVYGAPVVKGFNDKHPATTAYERLTKAEAVKRLKPDVIITGTSRADSGLDPREEFFPGLVSYNYGLSASSIREQAAVLEYSERVHPLKKLVMTLDFFSFNARHLENRAFDPAQLAPGALDEPRAFFNTYGTILSLDMLIASVKHIQALKHMDRRGYLLANGRKDDTDIAWDIAQNGIRQRFNLPEGAGAEADNDVARPAFDDFSFSYSDKPGDDSFRSYAAMLDFARAHGIETVMLISPTHVDDPPGPAVVAHAALEKEWQKRLVALDRANALKWNAAPYPLWDFNYPNSATTEPVPSAPHKDMRWFWDAGHYRAELGDIVLRRVLGLPERRFPDFGRRLI